MSKTELDKLADELVRLNSVFYADLDDPDRVRMDEIETLIMDDYWEVVKGAWNKASRLRRERYHQ